MSSARTTAQLPQSTTVSVHSKSHVLAGVQDAYWSDDENEDAECPLCMEPMDVSDLGFRPCPCGYQICSFCWNHIKQNLNGRCPACRREYTDDAVEFTKIPGEEMKRLNQQKKIKERERKDIEQLGRKQYLNVRIVQRNHVYVVGLGPRLAKEEFIPSLRSNDYFGQYGKISKILLVKRNQAGSAPVTGLYVTYHRREDAARAIQAVDGTPTPGGNGEIMRASHGTTKYCMSFLRNVSCSQPGCMDMHDWADERDCFTKEDLTSLKHTMKDTELGKLNGRRDDGSALPRSAAWAQKGASTPSTPSGLPPPLPRSRQGRESQRERTRNKDSQGTPATVRSRGGQQTRLITAIAPKPIPASLASPTGSSRPSTPARITTPENVPALPQLTSQTLLPPTSPPPPARSPDSVAQESEGGSSAPGGVLPTTLPHVPLEVVQSPPPPIPSAPPGLPPPTRGPYHMSTQAQALIDDVRARREVSQSSTSNAPSPFPDFDRTLASLGDDGTSFSFSLDQALAGGIGADLELEHELAFGSSIAAAFDPFAVQPHGLKTAALLGQPTGLSGPPGLAGPPGLGGPPGLPAPPGLTSPMADGFGSSMAPSSSSLATLNGFNGLNGAPLVKSTYSGSFNPFDMEPADALKRGPGGPDDMRGVSRFGFARGRQATTSATTSPFLGHSPLDSDVIGDGRRLNMAQQLGELPGPLPIQQVSPWGNLQQAPQAQHQQPQQHQHQQPRHHHQQQQHQQQQQQQHHYQQQNHQPPMHHQPAQHSQLPNQMRYPPGIVPQHLLQAQQYLQQQQQQQQQHQQQQEQPQLSRYGAGNMGGAGATFAPFDDYRPPAAQAQAQVPSGVSPDTRAPRTHALAWAPPADANPHGRGVQPRPEQTLSVPSAPWAVSSSPQTMSQARAFAVPPPSFQSNVNTVYSVHPQQSLAPQALAPTVFTPSSLLPQFESRLYSQSIQSSVTHHQASSSRFLPSQQQPSKPPYQSHRGSLSSFSVASSVSMSPYSLLADPFLASSSVRQQHIIPPGPWASATQSQAHRSSVNLASPHASTRSYRSSFGESPTIMALQGSATIMSRPPPIVSPSTSASLSQSMVVVESPAIESLQSISQRSSMSIPQPLTFASALSSNAASPAIAAPAALIIPTLVPPPVVPSISSSDFPALPTVSAAHLPPSVAKSAAEKKTRKQSTAEISFARETSSAKSTPPIDDLGQKTPKPLETVLKAAVPTVSAKLSLSVPSTPVKESSLRVAASSGQLDESTISAVTGRAVAVVQVVPNAEMKKSRKDKKKEKRTTGDTKEAGQQLKDVDGDIGSGGSALRKGGQPISTPEPPHLSAASTSSEAKAAPPSQAVEMPVKEVKKKAALSVETSFTPTTATDLSAAAAPTTPSKPSRPAKELSVSTSATPSIPDPVPMVSKMPKKFKPLVAKPVKAKEETPAPELEYSESQVPTDQPVSSSGDSTAILDAHDGYTTPRANLADLIDQLIDHDVDLEAFAFFTPSLLETKLQTPLKYGPLVHALSALSVGGGSFANTLPSGSIDTAVSSFQQLLETLTQTISDLLRLLPRNTWDDSSSFDGVLRDMLKGDDFLDEHGEGRGTPGPTIQEQMLVDGRDDEVAVLTQALEKRARWMEVQLAKLEELHRDINTAAVRAVLSLNDAGWDRIAPDEGRFDHIPEVFLPRSGGTIQGYDEMTAAASRMTVAELETQLAKEQERELAAEDALLRVMNANTQLLGYD